MPIAIYTAVLSEAHAHALAWLLDHSGLIRGATVLEIIITNSSDKPIYEQITSQIKASILSGELVEGQRLPSIRALANDLRISVITTKRAYADLEAWGFIETVQGKGSFVASGNAEMMREMRLRKVEGLLEAALSEAREMGLDVADLHELLDVMNEGE